MIQALKAYTNGTMPNRLDVSAAPGDPRTAEIAGIVARNGIFDMGLTNSRFGATRPQHFPILQKVLNGKLTPVESIKAYNEALNEALK